MMIEAETAELIRQWNDELPHPVSVRLVRSLDERGSALTAFLQAFTSVANKVHFSPSEEDEDTLPAILLGTSVHWQAIPEGGELLPFLKALEMHSSPVRVAASVPEAVRSHIESVSLPADLKVYITPQCPYCPRVLSEIVPLALLNPLLHLAVIDGEIFAELASRDCIRSVPTVILDDTFRWTGAGHMSEIINAILNRDPARMSSKSLEDFLKNGNAETLAQMMMDRRQVFPAFVSLFESSNWSVRLGAMVVEEEIAEKNPELSDEILDLLWHRLDGISGPARGDVMYLFGLVQPGSQLWIDRLQGILEKEDEEVREIVMESLSKLLRNRKEQL
jgi:hypothetical protein